MTLPLITLQKGVSKNPESLTRAQVVRDEINPTFFPSGVSIGQILP